MQSVTHRIDVAISNSNVQSLFETWLRAQGFVRDNETITITKIGGLEMDKPILPFSYEIKERTQIVEGNV